MDTWHNSHDELILTSEVTYFQAESFSGTMGFFRISAVDNAPIPNVSKFSEVVTFRHSNFGKGLLIIDSFSHDNSTSELPYAGNIGLLADNHELGIATINDTLFSLDSNFTIPTNYLPIILTGNSTHGIPVTLIQQLESSSFWILGSKSSESLTMSTTGNDLLQNYLGVEFTGSVPVPTELMGIDSPYESFSTTDLIMNIGIDSINSVGGLLDESLAYPILADSLGIVFGFAVSNPLSLLSSIPLEILNEEDRIDYFNRAIEFLIDTTLSIARNNFIPTEATITFYPNPFNSNGTIKINSDIGLYHIKLFNILGQLVWAKDLSIHQFGDVTFQIPKRVREKLTSGLYFIQFEKNNQQIASTKILLLK